MVAPWFKDEAAMSRYGAQWVAQGSPKGRAHGQKKGKNFGWPLWRWPLALDPWRCPWRRPLALAPGAGPLAPVPWRQSPPSPPPGPPRENPPPAQPSRAKSTASLRSASLRSAHKNWMLTRRGAADFESVLRPESESA